MATLLNLLDWRAEQREQRKREFGVMAGGAFAVGVLLFGVIWLGATARLDSQIQRNERLRGEITEIERKTKEIQDLERTKANLLARMRVIEQLQQSRTATVHFFDEIINTLPEGVYITSLKQTGKKIEITGVAESNGRVSTYIKNFEGSQWFTDPRLVVITSAEKNKTRTSSFTLTVTNLTQPQAQNPDGEG
ncbi:MAG: PilN domain-containing protein [Pseudomonadota bacterium]